MTRLNMSQDEVNEMHSRLDALWERVRDDADRDGFKHVGIMMVELACSALTTALSGPPAENIVRRFNEHAEHKDVPYRLVRRTQ